jgi:hypothetical protein
MWLRVALFHASAGDATNEKIAVDECRKCMYVRTMTMRPAKPPARRPIGLAALRGFEAAARHLYEAKGCARGEMENRIKELQPARNQLRCGPGDPSS